MTKTLRTSRRAGHRLDISGGACSDPVGDYLDQLRQYPLLSVEEEVTIARQLRDVRERLRRVLLCNHYMLTGAIEILRGVSQGRARADRVLETTVFDTAAYRQATANLPLTVWRLERLVARNRHDAGRFVHLAAPVFARRPYAIRLKARCRAAAAMVWQAKLRLKTIHPHWLRLRAINERMQCLERALQHGGNRRAELERELARLMELTGMRPRALARWMALTSALVARYDALKHRLARHNLRLVVSIAKHYAHSDPELLDLIQEGNAGLLRAVDKFEPLGFRFTTYATWWIKQAITRSLIERNGLIVLPREKLRSLHRLQKSRRDWFKQHGRTPTIEEQMEATHLPQADAETLLKFDRPLLSLDLTAPETEGTLGELLEDQHHDEPQGELNRQALSDLVNQALVELNQREREVIQLRYGLTDNQFRTLDEVGKLIGVSGERVRQIEQRAVARLRSSRHGGTLQAFLEP